MLQKPGIQSLLSIIAITAASLFPLHAAADTTSQTATGVVFHDTNNNQKFDSGEPPLHNIRVSNGRDVVRTDAQGRYSLPVDDDTILFVIKPTGWRTLTDEDMLPRFYYIHKPAGSPPSKHAGVEPTGPLPQSVDFPLYPQDEMNHFKVVFFADPQPRNIKEVEYVYHDVVEQLIGTDAAFGVTLGDIAFDNLNTLIPQNRGIAQIGVPWYNVIGNHDLNFESPGDADSDETFHRIFGPNYYSFDYGNVHFIALDDINWRRPDPDKKGSYNARIDDKQLEFLRNDLALVPTDQTVVLMMHIPLIQVKNRQKLYRLIENRPVCVSISGHTHYQQHHFISQDDGWRGAKPHHHIINATVSGSWWRGHKDELGIPHASMRDGAPNGYSIMTFSSGKFDWEFIPARRPADNQMHIWAPEAWRADGSTTEILVNIYGGSERSTAEMKVGKNDRWVRMDKVERVDPYYQRLKNLEVMTGATRAETLPATIPSPHLWRAMLPGDLTTGTQTITVRTTDVFGKQYTGNRLIRIQPERPQP